ncbi:MAG: endonuclease/exonuclease/phosphatase family protein [Bacteroidales bacterium]|nr:endonuclease/exonuclease/phosphatase family protein [Bacteroidales bacterium]
MTKKVYSLVFIGIIVLCSFTKSSYTQEEKAYKVISIGYYNLENLFDTINQTELLISEEFTPEGPKQWTSQRYYEKLGNMADVISQIGIDLVPTGITILGVSEIENITVLEDLVAHEKLKERNYKIVHYDSPDRRGIDVGLIYQADYFTVTDSKSYPLTMEGDTGFRSRDQLLVTGKLDGETFHLIVNHWPSRRGGERASRPKRNAAGKLARHISDSLLTLDKNAKIIIMGDLNDDPVNPSVKTHLRAKGRQDQLENGDLFNPMYKMYKDGIGSLAYRDSWNLFDQLILSQGLLGDNYSDYKFHKAKIFNKNFMVQKDGAYQGYPWRTYAGGVYSGGYSDHFPVYLFLIKEAK